MFCLYQQADLLAVFFYHFSAAMLFAMVEVHLLVCCVLKRRFSFADATASVM